MKARLRRSQPPRQQLQKSTEKRSSDPMRITVCELTCVFSIFVIARIASACLNNINDCDETFNYWEPAHFLLYRSGFQTWEYSPQYAIRSYFYLWLYIWPAALMKHLVDDVEDKVVFFFLTRAFLALVGAATETFFFL